MTISLENIKKFSRAVSIPNIVFAGATIAITANIFLTQRAAAAPIIMQTPNSISSGEYCRTYTSLAVSVSHHAIRKDIDFNQLEELKELGLIRYTVFNSDALDENGKAVKYDGVVIFELYNRNNTDKYVNINGQDMTFQQYLFDYYEIQFKTVPKENKIENCQHRPIPANFNNVKLYIYDSQYTNSIVPVSTAKEGNSGSSVFYYNENNRQIIIGTILSINEESYNFYNNTDDVIVNMLIN